jgi:hypothetical protein
MVELYFNANYIWPCLVCLLCCLLGYVCYFGGILEVQYEMWKVSGDGDGVRSESRLLLTRNEIVEGSERLNRNSKVSSIIANFIPALCYSSCRCLWVSLSETKRKIQTPPNAVTRTQAPCPCDFSCYQANIIPGISLSLHIISC